MRKMLFISVLITLAMIAVCAPISYAQDKPENSAALQGFDPVLLVQGKEVKGDEKLSISKSGFKYLFTNPENKAKFEKEPKMYEIQMAGECPVVPGADGNPDIFSVYKERIYIFASENCRTSFKGNPEQYLKP